MLRPEKDVLASSHEVPLLKGVSKECFHTCDRVDLRDKFDPTLLGGGARSGLRLICDRLHRLLCGLQRPWSESSRQKMSVENALLFAFYYRIFKIIYTSASCEDMQMHTIFSLIYFCILKFHDPH